MELKVSNSVFPFLFTFCLFFSLSSSFGIPKSRSKIIDWNLRKSFEIEKVSSIDIFISFRQGNPTQILNSLTHKNFPNRQTKLKEIRSALVRNTETIQGPILDFLSSQQIEFKSFWITNQVFIKNAHWDLIKQLASKFNREISFITHEEPYKIDKVIVKDLHEEENLPPPALQWGIKKINAPQVWENGYDGTNVIVGTVDTGVRFTHEAISHNRKSGVSWLDPYVGDPEPEDDNGHGTHTMATILGSHGVGVAPGAKWITCRGCLALICMPEALLECGQFMVCPDPEEDCSNAPDVINCSWGGGQGRDMYWGVLKVWRESGIIPVYSNGNSGPICGSANSPADSGMVIAVGATTNTDSIVSFSSVGPTVYGTIKPDISAPGESIVSAFYSGDHDYKLMSGTSMSAPHVTGVIALLKSYDPNLDYDSIRHYLHNHADRNLTLTGKNCGGVDESSWPNNAFGYGRIDAYNSFQNLVQVLKNSH